MSGRSGDRLTVNSRTRFSCSERTPTMKKLPRPTASSTMRAWLPGPAQLQHGVTQRKPRASAPAAESARIKRDARQVQHECRAPQTRRRPRRRLEASRPARWSARPGRRRPPTSRRSASRSSRRVPASSRSSSDGLTCADLEQRHQREQHRHQQADAEALQRPPAPSASSRRRCPGVAAAASVDGIAAMASAGEQHAKRAAGQARARSPASCRSSAAGSIARRGTSGSRCCGSSAATNTRVTLDTPMPPRITITRPTRLR